MPEGWRRTVGLALTGARFEFLITVLILVNAGILGFLTYQEPGTPLFNILLAIDVAIVLVFIIEIALKILALGGLFFRSGWNWFDLIVIVVSILSLGTQVTVLRALRVFRTLRLTIRVPSMRGVIESFVSALPGIGSVLGVLLMVFFIASVVATSLYSKVAPDLFGNLHDSAFTLFTVMTLEGWPDVARQVMDKKPSAWIFFVTFIVVTSFTVLNLIIAVIVDAMQREYEREAEDEREDMLAALRALQKDVAALRRDQSKSQDQG